MRECCCRWPCWLLCTARFLSDRDYARHFTGMQRSLKIELIVKIKMLNMIHTEAG